MFIRSIFQTVLASVLIASMASAQTSTNATGSLSTTPLAVLAAGQMVSPPSDPRVRIPQEDGGWRPPLVLTYVAPPPSTAEPTLEDPAAAARETAAARRLRLRAHAQTICERTERDTALREACIACASRGEAHVWLGQNDASIDYLRTLASMQNQPLTEFRCQDRRLRRTMTLMGVLAHRFQDVEQRVSVAQTQIAGLRDAQGPIEPRLMPQLVQLALGTQMRMHLETEIGELAARVRDCREGRLDTDGVRNDDRGRPEAPASMVAWSEEQIRAAGYRPRVPNAVRPDCSAIERQVTSLRAALEERIQAGALPVWTRVGAMELALRTVTTTCAAGPSPACAEAQATLSRLLTAP